MKNSKRTKKRRILIAAFAIAAVFAADVVMWSAHVSDIMPYSICSRDGVVCSVDDRKTAKQVMNAVIARLSREDADIKALKSDYYIARAAGSPDILAEDEAEDAVLAAVEEQDSSITVVSVGEEDQTFTPDPEYVRDGMMYAGQSELRSEGEDGSKKVRYSYTTVNGRTEGADELDYQTLSGGTPAVIAKGTLGLPTGEDWKSYEGDPVASNGDDIITSATSYVGKVPYVWGGKSLETGVDCSGFVIAIYRLYGVNLNYPLDSEGVGVSYANAQPGDILHFPGHYGLYIGNGKMVHASNKRTGVIVSDVGNRRILAVRRIVTG